MKCGIGDAAEIRARQVRKQKTDRRDAAHILDLLLKNDFPRIWTPSQQEPDLRQLLIHRFKLVTLRVRVKNELQHLAMNQGLQKGRRLWSRAGQKQLLELPLALWAGVRRQNLLKLLKKLDEQMAVLDQAVKKVAEENEKARLLMTRQAGSQLSRAHSHRVQFRRQATIGRNQQTRQSFSAHAVVGSRPGGSSL